MFFLFAFIFSETQLERKTRAGCSLFDGSFINLLIIPSFFALFQSFLKANKIHHIVITKFNMVERKVTVTLTKQRPQILQMQCYLI